MIALHKVNGAEVVINAELIESVEPGQQTVVVLSTGNRILVRETAGEIIQKVVEYRRKVNAEAKPAFPPQGFEKKP